MQFNFFSERLLRAAPQRLAAIAAVLFCSTVKPALAQATLDLPDAPGVVRLAQDTPAAQNFSAPSSVATPAQNQNPLPEASPTERYPKPGQPSPILTPRDKVRMALHGAFSPFAATGWVFAAGYEQLTNTAPNWGTDRGAYGERLGSAALRGTTEDFLSDGIMAPLLHQDPRYYRLGPGHNALVRIAYAVTRPLITRTDAGRTVPNFALMGGNLAGSALTNAYYPQMNRTVAQTFSTFGSGLAGSAIGDGIAEFFGNILFDHDLHSHKP